MLYGRYSIMNSIVHYVVHTQMILYVALDLDNNKLYFSKNGTWYQWRSTTGATGTGCMYIILWMDYVYDVLYDAGQVEVNFGSPPYLQSHQATQMVMAMETLNMQYLVDIMHLTQKT